MVDELETIGGALEDIRAFCAVAEFGTVSAAARQLGETKGSISRRLSRLEHRLGVALLARAPRAVSPTEEGTAFYIKAREALAWLDDAAEGARQSQDVPQGHLRVTAPVDIGIELLPPIVAKFRTLHPQITVEFLLTDTPLDLAANRIDLALRAQDGNLPDMVYRASSVAQLRVGLYASPDYLEANGWSGDTPAALAEHHFVISREFTGAAQLMLKGPRGRTHEVVIRPSIRTSDYASVLRLAIAGAGIGPIPDLVAAAHVASRALVPVLADWSLSEGQLYAISLNGQKAPARVRVFREFVRRELNAV
ncbi:LysR family transcriptional regulator [Vreelandella zhanjiangensis]|uniref:LysR family transcriptional regulator n=1 Tax=Vreelandella zhanjiangensis TaxID=1121960 RepID=UPI0003727634|nr:LysR family transcriptional regulator [Halomonas zhanjiangensis]